MRYLYKQRNAAWILAASLVLPYVALSQQKPPEPPLKDEAPKAAGTSMPGVPGDVALDDAHATLEPAAPPNPYAGTINDVSTGLPLFGTSSTPLRWGDFSVNSFDFLGLHDTFNVANGPASVTSDIFFFRLGLMFDHAMWKNKSRIVLQYLPQMAIANGEVHANAAVNNNVSLGTKFELTPRLSLNVNDTFTQSVSNPLLPLNYFSADLNSGSLVQNNFLDTNGSFLGDSASGVFEYALSPRTNVTFSPLYRYAHASSNLLGSEATGETYQGIATLGHALTPRRTVGLMYSYQYENEAIVGSTEDITYHTFGVFYSEQLARTFWVAANAGAVKQNDATVANLNGWGFNGGFSLIEQFGPRINLSVGYRRGVNFNNYVTIDRSDRVDASLAFKLSARVTWNNGAGYYRELGAHPNTFAKYAQSDLSYRMFGSLSFFTTFNYAFQSSNTFQLLSGNSKTIAYGFRWSPGRRLG